MDLGFRVQVFPEGQPGSPESHSGSPEGHTSSSESHVSHDSVSYTCSRHSLQIKIGEILFPPKRVSLTNADCS